MFLLLQGLVALHAADYGVGEHEHEGQICELYVHAEKNYAVDNGDISALSFASIAYDAPLGMAFSNIISSEYPSRNARAPPAFS